MIEVYVSKLLNKFVNRPLLKARLKECGKNFKIGYKSELRNSRYFSIGDNFFSGPYGYFVTNEFIPVKIGNHIMFGPFCKIFGGNHDIKYTKNHIYYAPESKVEGKKIVIEDGAWIGANTTILTNTYICEGAVVASGAIISHYIPPYCIAYGIPAKRFKRRFNDKELMEVLQNTNSKYKFEQLLDIYQKHEIYL
ncbi:acyltransferase [uncultured Algibacter sp.]|uniref:acyltransferase n=1 Tax=uncultured Algibacter sp. TaxID=298659 RepID=UPI0026131EA1|nr:acyltransferase [uncultured Algibacter sp.]